MEVHMNEWAFNQGMVGYKRILDYFGLTVPTTANGIIVKKEHLEQLPDAYFTYFLAKMNVAKQNERSLRSWHSQWKKGKKDYKKYLNNRLKDIHDKVKKYFKDDENGQMILENIKRYRKKRTYTEEMDHWLEKVIQGIHTETINEKLTMNVIKTVYLQQLYFGQPSFVNVVHNAKTLEEQKEIFRKDYIQPVFDEWRLMDYIHRGDADNCRALLQQTEHKQLSSLKRPFNKRTAEEMKDYIEEEVLKCSLTDFPLGFYAFEESVFSPLALSLKNALNSTWNSEGRNFFPISALAKLLLFCSPAGATIHRRKSIFVQFDGRFDEIYQANEHYYTEADRDKSFDEVIFDLAREQKLRADMLQKNYFILEYESDYNAKKTELDYMVLTPNLIQLFQKHRKLFHYIHSQNRSQFIKFLLKNIDTKHFISHILRDKIKNNYSSLEVMFMTILRHYAKFYARGDEYPMNADKQQNYIWVLYKSAEAVRAKIGLKKAQGIAYRLLNAVQSDNKNTFMDTIMRVYVSSELEMPPVLLEALHENNLDFATVGNAWIAGLISKQNEEGEDSYEQ